MVEECNDLWNGLISHTNSVYYFSKRPHHPFPKYNEQCGQETIDGAASSKSVHLPLIGLKEEQKQYLYKFDAPFHDGLVDEKFLGACAHLCCINGFYTSSIMYKSVFALEKSLGLHEAVFRVLFAEINSLDDLDFVKIPVEQLVENMSDSYFKNIRFSHEEQEEGLVNAQSSFPSAGPSVMSVPAVLKPDVDFSQYRETEDSPAPEHGGDYDTSPNDVFVTGEDGILEKICQTYRISTFEADEILTAHRAFDGSTLNLKANYSIHFIEQTEEFLAAKDRNKGKTGFFGAFNKLTTTLAREPRDMWRKFQETRQLHRSLVKIVETYELPKATSERPESILTAIYNIRNEAGDIDNPQDSMEGRRIFDTLRRKEHLLERLDI